MVSKKIKNEKLRKRLVRKLRIRNKVSGTTQRPRISVYRSNKHIMVQAVNDETSTTICSVSSLGKGASSCNLEKAKALGQELGEKLNSLNISTAVYDRNGFLYHGQVAAVAEGLRAKGIRV